MAEIPLLRDKDSNLVIVEGTITHGQYKPIVIPFVLDTACGCIVLPQWVPKRIGISLKKASKRTILGIKGWRVRVKEFQFDGLAVGGEKVPNVTAMAYNFPRQTNIVAVLGLEFLKYYTFTLDFDENQLILNPGSSHPGATEI